MINYLFTEKEGKDGFKIEHSNEQNNFNETRFKVHKACTAALLPNPVLANQGLFSVEEISCTAPPYDPLCLSPFGQSVYVGPGEEPTAHTSRLMKLSVVTAKPADHHASRLARALKPLRISQGSKLNQSCPDPGLW